MLRITPLRDGEYLLSAVAAGVEDYYMGAREAPGVWAGRFAGTLGLAGVVEAADLRALVEGRDPATGVDLLAGRPPRKNNCYDLTLSAPKSASVLWAFATPEVASVVARTHVEATEVALGFLEDRAAVARQQVAGVRRALITGGWAAATFVHRTSRAGDPQLHTHALVANLVRRADGTHVAMEGTAMHEWAKAAGCLYQEELRRRLTERLGVVWGPDRNGCREMVGFSDSQLARFSKRSAQIEAWLQAHGARYESPVARMRADEAASLATRPAKDPGLTPEALRESWAAEAAGVGLGGPEAVEAAVCGRAVPQPAPGFDEVVAALVDAESGLCARDSRFGEAQVVERIAAAGAGRLGVAEVTRLARAFLATDHVVRLAEPPSTGRARSARWSTAAHRAMEDRVLGHLGALVSRPGPGLDP
ncbi:MAG TPA: MobF family relaxase, partial [Acidimicrobiales bacterium]|nr:MobF family relaxase [Acidimicrobiales bacterium]